MSESLPSVKVPLNTWVDLYAATGISLGIQIMIQNTGPSDAIITESVSAPTLPVGHNSIPVNEFLTNSSNSIGTWVFSELGTILQVEEA